MAKARPAQRPEEFEGSQEVEEQNGPIIEYFGPNADKVKFEADPKAKRIRVFATGHVLTDY